MRVFLRKTPPSRKHFFEWLKTAVLLFDCGTSTLKSLLSRVFSVPHVYPRPRKRLSRCTLDCGFKTPESPALRGFVAGLRTLATAALYLVLKSNGLRHSKNPPVKFSFSLKIVPATIAKKLPPQVPSQTISHHDFQLLAQMARACFCGQKCTHSALLKGLHTTAHTPKQGLSSLGHSTVLCCQRNRHRKNSRRKRMHAYGVCPLPPASRPRWAAQFFCASAKPTKSVAIAFILW